MTSADPPEAAPVLFEALCTPRQSLGPRGVRVVTGLVLAGSLATGGLFLALGAWPVVGFSGLEAALVLGLLALHRRRGRRSAELLLLTEGRLSIRRTDHRGRRQALELDPYWTRLTLLERPGRASALLLRSHGRSVEVGALLGEAERQDLAAALGAALRRLREPVFHNPQLREAPGGPTRARSGS